MYWEFSLRNKKDINLLYVYGCIGLRRKSHNETERHLSTDIKSNRWANDNVMGNLFLEKSDVSIIWITNQIHHVAPSWRDVYFFAWVKYSEEEQIDAPYESLLKPLSKTDLSEKETQRLHRIKTLTPGDFHVVKGKFSSIFSEKDDPSNDDLIKALEQETSFKENKSESGYRRIGFIWRYVSLEINLVIETFVLNPSKNSFTGCIIRSIAFIGHRSD